MDGLFQRRASDLFQETGLQHEAARIHLAIDLMVAADQSDAFDLGAHLERGR